MGNSNEFWGYKIVEDNLEYYVKILKNEYIDKGLIILEIIGFKYVLIVNVINDLGYINNNWIFIVKFIMV